MTDEQFERHLPELMEQLAGDDDRYIEDVLRLTARMSQRPTWSFASRWLPVSGVPAREPMRGVRAVPLAALFLILAILALLVAMAVFVGNQRQSHLAVPVVSNGSVAFAVPTGRHEGSDIYLAINGIPERRIIGADGDSLREVCPSFSPDGTRLAYSESPSIHNGESPGPGGAVVILTVDEAGQPVGPILRLPAPLPGDVCPMWSPDSQTIAFAAGLPQQQLWIGHLDGTETRVGSWSSTGNSFSFDRPTNGAATDFGNAQTSAWVDRLTEGPARRVLKARPGIEFSDFQWSPDGTRLAAVATTYADGSDGSRTSMGSHVEVYRADGSGSPIELPGGSSLRWSPDGQRIAYVGDSAPGSNPTEILSVDPDTQEIRVLASEPAWIRGLMWSPDGSRLVYVSDEGASGTLVSIAAVGDPNPVAVTQQSHSFEYTSSDNISWQPVFE